MPIVPGPQQISLDVPGASIAGGGSDPIASALAQTGAQLQESSYQLLAQVKQAEAQEEFSKMKLDDEMEAEKVKTQMLVSSPDGFVYEDDGTQRLNADKSPRTVTQEYRDWANARYRENQGKATSGLSQDLYRAKQGEYFAGEVKSLQATEFQLRISALKEKQDGRNRIESSQLVSNPTDPTTPLLYKLYSSTDKTSEEYLAKIARIDQAGQNFSGVYSSVEGKTRLREALAQRVEAMFDGGTNEILENVVKRGDKGDRMSAINEYRQALAGEDGLSQYRRRHGLPVVADMLDPNKKAEIDQKLIRLMATAKELDRTDFNARRRDTIAKLERGQSNPAAQQYITKMSDEMVLGGSLSPYERAVDVHAAFAAAEQIGKLTLDKSYGWQSDSAMMARERAAGAAANTQARAQIGGDAKDADIGGAVEQATIGQMSAYGNSLRTERDRDFIAYITSDRGPRRLQQLVGQMDFSDPATFRGKAKVVGEFNQLARDFHRQAYPGGQKAFSLLSQGQSETLAKTLQNPQYNVENTVFAIQGLRGSYGRDFPELMDMMIRRGNLTEAWRTVAMQPGELGLRDAVSALKSNVSIEKILSGGKYGSADYESALSQNEQWTNYTKGLANTYPSESHRRNAVESMRQAIMNKAVEMSQYQPNGRPSDYTDAAVEALIRKNVNPISATTKTGFFTRGATSYLNLPPRMGEYAIGPTQEAQIKTWVSENALSDASLAKIKPFDPRLVKQGAGPALPDDVRATQQKDFESQLKGSGRWVLDARDNNGGFVLKYEDRDGKGLITAKRKNSHGQLEDVRVPIDEVLKSAHTPGFFDKAGAAMQKLPYGKAGGTY